MVTLFAFIQMVISLYFTGYEGVAASSVNAQTTVVKGTAADGSVATVTISGRINPVIVAQDGF
jgi:hypothetical protein